MADKSKLWYLENFNLFKSLSKEKLDTLNVITHMKEIPKSEPIYFAKAPSNALFLLKRGRVKLTRTSSDGKEMIMGLVNSGEVFGEMSIMDEGERTDFAITMEPSLICAISKDDFQKFLNENPELNLKLTKLIGFKLRKFSERIEQLVFKDATQRVISFLVNLADENGKTIGDEIFVKPFLTHQDIAELTACSRQTVNSILADLREKKLINFDRRKLIIFKIDALKKLSG